MVTKRGADTGLVYKSLSLTKIHMVTKRVLSQSLRSARLSLTKIHMVTKLVNICKQFF